MPQQTMLFELKAPIVLCAMVFCPPRPNKDFIKEFLVFITDIMPKYGHICIVVDFNIHFCCPSKMLAKDVLYLIDSLNLEQSVVSPNYEYRHTLDFFFSWTTCENY